MTPNALIAPARLAGISVLRTQSDERLVDLVRAGNDAAFEVIVLRYRRPLLRYCSKLLPAERAEDAVQQTLARAYDSLRASGREMHLRAWLYRIAHNTALNALRDGGLGHEELSDQIDGVERPDQAFDKRQRLREVVAAVELLPERQRNAIVLRELEGRSYEEIASALGVSGGAVRQLLNRARSTLRAGASAVTPVGLVARAPWATEAGEGMATRVAELCAAGGAGVAVTKVCATALVTGAVFGGVATAPDDGDGGSARARPDRAEAAAPRSAGGATDASPASARIDDGAGRRRSGDDSGDARRRDESRHRSGREDHEERSRSGPGGGDDEGGDRGGPGPGDGSDSDRSGSGSGETGGSDLDRSGSSGSDAGDSESDSSGSGSGGSLSGDSGGSGSSGDGASGSSGSGSSGSGSDEPTDDD